MTNSFIARCCFPGDVDLDDVVMIPVINVTGSDCKIGVLTNTWQVSAGYVKVGSGIVLHETLDGYIAFIEAEVPHIGLSSDVVDQMHAYMGANMLGWSWIFALDCNASETMSDPVFNLGGKEFRIRKKLSTTMIRRCAVACLLTLAVGKGDKLSTIALGMGFLRGFQTVFDLEKSMVGYEFWSNLCCLFLFFGWDGDCQFRVAELLHRYWHCLVVSKQNYKQEDRPKS